jgi:hypothetical protein
VSYLNEYGVAAFVASLVVCVAVIVWRRLRGKLEPPAAISAGIPEARGDTA